MVFPHPDIFARVMNRSALPHDDIPGLGHLTAEQFDTQSFALRFAAVLRTTYPVLLCHLDLLFKRY